MDFYQNERLLNPFLFKKMEKYGSIFRGCEKVLEIGCANGEFLNRMRQEGIPAEGVDILGRHVQTCRQNGLKAYHQDAFVYLKARPAGSFDGFFCSNLLEHLTPEKAGRLLGLACHKLRPGGILALVTANPNNLGNMAGIFWTDLDHVRPYPLSLLSAMLKERGMEVVTAAEDESTRPQGLARRLVRKFRTLLIGPYFGPPEIYVVARKKRPPETRGSKL